MSDLVGNPEDRFSRVEAHLIPGKPLRRSEPAQEKLFVKPSKHRLWVVIFEATLGVMTS